MRRILGIAGLLCCLAGTAPAAEVKLLRCGALIDGAAGNVTHDVGVPIEGERIEGIGAFRAGSEPVIDRSRDTCLPGLIDAHTHSTQAIHAAIEAGARSIGHGTFLDEAGIRLMARRGTWLVPRFYVGDYYLEEQPRSEAQAKMNALTRQYRGQHLQAVSRALKAGVRVGVGTDYLGFPPQLGVRELQRLVEAGMTPMQALQAATSGNAELLGWQDRIGSIETGKLADIIAVPGNPLVDLAVLEHVAMVMIGGRLVTGTGG